MRPTGRSGRDACTDEAVRLLNLRRGEPRARTFGGQRAWGIGIPALFCQSACNFARRLTECRRDSDPNGPAAVKAAPAARRFAVWSLDCLVRREVGPACAQRAAMLITGGDFCFTLPPAVGRRSTACRTNFVSDRLPSQAAQVNSSTKRNECQNAEAFRNALARMNLLPRPLVDGSQHECPDARIHRLSIR